MGRAWRVVSRLRTTLLHCGMIYDIINTGNKEVVEGKLMIERKVI